MMTSSTYYIIGAAKTGYNLYKFMIKQGLNAILYASDIDYAKNKKKVKTISSFLKKNIPPHEIKNIIITSETAFDLLEKRYKNHFYSHYYLRDKKNIHEIAKKASMLSIEDINIDNINSFPIAVKPKQSMANKVPFKFKKINSYQELNKIYKLLENCLIQPYLDDSYKEYTICGYFDGDHKSLISCEKLNYYPKGISAFIKNTTIENKDYILKISNYLNSISFRGFIEIEFKVKNDHWYIMDINPRPWGYIYFYLNGMQNFRSVLLDNDAIRLNMKQQWINPLRLTLANLQGRLLNPTIKDLFNGSTCFEPLL